MKKAPDFEDLSKKMEKFNLSNYQALICKNIKRIRKELLEENKAYCKSHGINNPYATSAVAELLGISYEYYKRIESFDKTKPISIKILLKSMVLFDVDVSEFFKE